MIVSPWSLRPVGTQHTHRMTADKLKRFLEFETILRECGWQIVCASCADRFGDINKAGVRGDNDVTSQQYRVECSCSAHVFDAK